MEKRIVVVENDDEALSRIVATLRSVGYDILPIFVGSEPHQSCIDDFPKGTVFSEDLGVVVEAAKKYCPTMVLLDHDLGRMMDGKEIAAQLGMPKSTLVSISSLQCDYCQYSFELKNMMRLPGIPEQLLKLIASI